MHLLVIVLCFVATACGSSDDDSGNERAAGAGTGARTQELATNDKQWPEPPSMLIDPAKKYTATLDTPKGQVVVELQPKVAPIATNNFVFLAREGFYENVPIHRIIDGFMIQSGDPTGTGTGGPGYTIEDEKVTGTYTRGTLAMARTAAPNSQGSQFFIVLTDEGGAGLQSNPTYVIFGKVVRGMEVVDAIGKVPVQAGPSDEESTPASPIAIEKVTITEA